MCGCITIDGLELDIVFIGFSAISSFIVVVYYVKNN